MQPLMPDFDQVLVDYLAGHTALAPLHGGRVGTRLAAGVELCAVRVAGLGGPAPWPWESNPEYQAEWWGGTEDEAKTLARTGEAAIWGLLGPVAGGHVSGIAVPLTQLWQPDPNTGRARYLSQFRFTIHPEGAGP